MLGIPLSLNPFIYRHNQETKQDSVITKGIPYLLVCDLEYLVGITFELLTIYHD